MSGHDLFAAAAQKTGEDSHEIRRRGFMLVTPPQFLYQCS
jgi:hypothetical protein